MFATTEHLNLRAYRESDGSRLMELENNPLVSRYSQTDYVVPRGPKFLKGIEEKMVTPALMFVIIEAKNPLENAPGADSSREVSNEDELFVGYFALYMRIQKNRDANAAIALSPRWWGKGIGAQVMQWALGYSFEQLGLHRVSLGVFDGNDRAIKLYKKIGFVEEGRKRKAFWHSGKWVDSLAMGMLEEEWAASKQT